MTTFTKDPNRKRTWTTDFSISLFDPFLLEKTLKEHYPNAITAVFSHEAEPEFRQNMIQFDNDADEAEFILIKETLDI
jgi:hypothetical protein